MPTEAQHQSARHPIVHLVMFVVCVALAGCQGVIGDPGATGGSRGPGDGEPPRSTDGELLTAADVPVMGARRLSREELDSSLRDLLGDTNRLGTQFLPEDDTERNGLFLHWPFDNNYVNQQADKVLVLAFETIAKQAATDFVADEERRASLVPCAPTGADDAACLRMFVAEFARRAFRRPIPADEVDNFMRLHPFAVEADDFWVGVRFVVQAVLQSPDFLYRVEVGTPDSELDGVHHLDSWEIATRISYMLWATTPDDWLLALAETGDLTDPAVRRETAWQMLEDERAEWQVDRFHAMWLGYITLPHPPELTTPMRDETGALLRRVIFEEQMPYLDIFRAEETFLTPSLAEHYGLPAPDAEGSWVPYGDSGRQGILSHGAVLSALGSGGDTSATRRGIIVRERLMCQFLPPPPASVNADDIPETHCKSEQIEAHQVGACAGCHALMDPIGAGLESYDLSGRFREHDEGKPECVISGDGELADVGSFNGPGELAGLLIDEGSLEGCAIRQVVRFALGREERPDDEALITELQDERRGTEWTFLDLLVDIVASDRFVLRRDDTVGTEAPAGE